MYDTDYELWLREQIQALQQGKLEALDIPHLIRLVRNINL